MLKTIQRHKSLVRVSYVFNKPLNAKIDQSKVVRYQHDRPVHSFAHVFTDWPIQSPREYRVPVGLKQRSRPELNIILYTVPGKAYQVLVCTYEL